MSRPCCIMVCIDSSTSSTVGVQTGRVPGNRAKGRKLPHNPKKSEDLIGENDLLNFDSYPQAACNRRACEVRRPVRTMPPHHESACRGG